MNLEHLLEQAERLATAGVGRPRQADLRRAISTAYYALFHLLTQDGAKRIATHSGLRPLLARAYNHGDMKQVSDQFARNKLPANLHPLVTNISNDLRAVAEAFFALQAARHQADYDVQPDRQFTRAIALARVHQAREAFAAWRRVRDEPATEVYLIAMLLHPKLGR
jgi:hypothetical protein